MAENLDYYDGSSRCYEDKTNYCKRDGALYNWTSAKRACPAGWHLPKDEEWATLENTVGGASTAGTKLKATSGWLDSTGKKPLNGTDDFGFSALPAGVSGVYVSSNGAPSKIFSKNGSVGSWWTASDKGNDGFYRSISEAKSESASANKTNVYYSVRCVQGEAPTTKQAEKGQPKQTEQPKQQSSNENCSITFPKKSCVSMPTGTCKMAGGKVVDKCP